MLLLLQNYFLLRVAFLIPFSAELSPVLIFFPVKNILFHHFSSSHRRCSVKKVFLKFRKIGMKTPVLESLFNKVTGLQACRTNFYNDIWSSVIATNDRRASSCVSITHISQRKVDLPGHLGPSHIFYTNFCTPHDQWNIQYSVKHMVQLR